MTELGIMEDSWIFIDDDSSCGSLTDSDEIDSETEAELYSKIHHESNFTSIDSENLTEKPPVLLVLSPFTKNESTHVGSNREHLFLDQNSSNVKRKSSEMNGSSKKSDEKLSPVKKRKLNATCQSVNLEDKSDSQQLKISNLQNKSRSFNSLTERKLNYGNNRFVLESSDSDNDIWIEPHSNDKSDLKINLLENPDTIFLSSSDSENDISFPFMKRDSILKNLSMPIIKTDRNSKGLWHINCEDLNRSKMFSNRYHESFDVTCSNCNKKGHTYRTCPSPKVIKCFVCGGNHMGFRCSNRMCSNCHAYGHDRKDCWKEVYRGFCHLCKMGGHAKGNCPDLWRRFHLSTSPTKLVKGNKAIQDTNLYCWNCGREGHFGADCYMSYRSRNTFSTWPCVVSYTNPKYFLKSRLFYYGKLSSLNTEKPTENFNNASSTSSVFNEESRVKKVKKKKLERPDLRLNEAKGVMKERDFPRTPKNENPVNCSSTPMKSEEKKRLPGFIVNKEFAKLKRQFNKKVKKDGVQPHEVMTEDYVSKMLDEKFPAEPESEVPEIIKKEVQKRFNRYRKRRIASLKQNIAK